MSKEKTKIYFVTWPNGKILEGSQTSVAERFAVGRAVATFLPKQFFPDLDLSQAFYGSLGTLWQSMQTAGFRVQSVETEAKGLSS